MRAARRFPVYLFGIALALDAATSFALSTYWADHERGWHFYEDPAIEQDAVAPAPAAPAIAPELAEFEQLRKTLEDTRNIAIMRPTPENVRRYMELEASVVARASHFADVARRVAWATPALDPTLQGRPVNARALEVFEQRQMKDRAAIVASLGKDHALFFSTARIAPTAALSPRSCGIFVSATAYRSSL